MWKRRPILLAFTVIVSGPLLLWLLAIVASTIASVSLEAERADLHVGPVRTVFTAVLDRDGHGTSVEEWDIQRLGFSIEKFRSRNGDHLLRIWIDTWLITTLAAIMPAIVVAIWVRDRRRAIRAGLCVSCGYDLRASGGDCPECGAKRGA